MPVNVVPETAVLLLSAGADVGVVGCIPTVLGVTICPRNHVLLSGNVIKVTNLIS